MQRNERNITCLLTCLLLLAPWPPAAALTFKTNVSGATGPLRFPLLDCVGSGHGTLTLREDYRAHLRSFRRDVSVRSVRGHAWLSDDMSTLLNGHANMFNMFSTLDFYLSIGIKPILELTFMPDDFASGNSTIMHYKGNTSPPKSYPDWAAFIVEVYQLLVQRYGIDEVRQWRSEVWNEPDGGFWTGGRDGYFTLYNYTARAIKSVDPFLLVGGPATAALQWVNPTDHSFIDFVQANQVPCDFVSTHLYPTDNIAHTRTTFEDAVHATSNVAAAAGLPLVITEFSAGLWNDVYDEPYAAAFLIHAAFAFQSVPNVRTLSYWTFTDVFEEPGFESTPYNQKYGAQTVYGVPKPSYRALQLVSQQPTTGLPVEASASRRFAGRGAADGVAAASPGVATVGTADAIVGVEVLDTTSRVVALLTNFNMIGTTVTRIDATHAYAKRVWVAAGSPVYPSTAEIDDEMAASALVPEEVPLTPVTGGVSLSLTMEPYSVAQVVLTFSRS